MPKITIEFNTDELTPNRQQAFNAFVYDTPLGVDQTKPKIVTTADLKEELAAVVPVDVIVVNTAGQTVQAPMMQTAGQELDPIVSANPNGEPLWSDKTPMMQSDNAPAQEPMVADNPLVDSEGFVWDERIHASTKTQKKDKTWKKLKGVSNEVYYAIRAELQADGPAPTEPPSTAAFVQPGPDAEMHTQATTAETTGAPETGEPDEAPDAGAVFAALQGHDAAVIAAAWAHIGHDPTNMSVLFSDESARVKMMEFLNDA